MTLVAIMCILLCKSEVWAGFGFAFLWLFFPEDWVEKQPRCGRIKSSIYEQYHPSKNRFSKPAPFW